MNFIELEEITDQAENLISLSDMVWGLCHGDMGMLSIPSEKNYNSKRNKFYNKLAFGIILVYIVLDLLAMI